MSIASPLSKIQEKMSAAVRVSALMGAGQEPPAKWLALNPSRAEAYVIMEQEQEIEEGGNSDTLARCPIETVGAGTD